MINWGWRTKPRSVLKTIEWLKFFKKYLQKFDSNGSSQLHKTVLFSKCSV